MGKSLDKSTDSQVISRESALQTIGSLRAKYGEYGKSLAEANEANTRLLLIDNVLLSLGWQKDQFNAEQAVSKLSYIDYLLEIDKIPRLVVEAKRVNYTFGPPRRKSRKNHYTITYLRSAFGQAFSEVLSQAERYALQNKVPFAILTNGGEWLLVQLALTPGFSELNDLRGIYFGNILSDDFSFELFWELLCMSHVEAGSLENYFAQLNSKEADYSRMPQAQFGSLSWHIPEDTSSLQDFYFYFFDEMIDPGRRNMLEKCFVSSSDLDHYQGELQRTLRDSAPHFIENAIDLSPNERGELLAKETGDQKGRVVLITGSVGSGKTTLVHKVLVETRQSKELDVLIIDLINEVGTVTGVSSQLWRLIEREWRKLRPESLQYDILCKIFGRQLSSLRKGPFAKLFETDGLSAAAINKEAEYLEELTSDPETYFENCWRYFQDKYRGIVVFFDNVDRASQTYQQEVYAFAHELAHRTGATVLMTMREFTYFRGREAGFLDIRSSDKVFHLRSPNLVQILSKRIRYVEKHLDGDHRLSKWRRQHDWAQRRNKFLNHADALKQTFLKDKEGQDRLSILESIAWHNVRRFLANLRQLHVMLGNEYRPWELSEIVAALMTPFSGGPRSSVLGNIYRPSYTSFQCYFLKLRILLLQTVGQPEYQTKHGTTFDRITSFMSMYGYHERWTRRAIRELVQEQLLECLEAPSERDFTQNYEVQREHSYRPSPLSIVLVERIISEPVYLCLIGNDLPFHTPKAFEDYAKSLIEVNQELGSDQLEREVIGPISRANLGKIVATYLVSMFERELPPENLLNHVPEIGATEYRLKEIMDILRQFAEVRMPLPQRKELATQLTLFIEESQVIEASHIKSIPVPENIYEARIERSEQAPLIFWALVALRHSGNEFSTGAEITRVINEYLLDDHNRKAPNNISRSLRSKGLRSQPWLLAKRISARKELFGLASDWEINWLEIFGQRPPDLNIN
ncbi:MAG: hypothetical protein KDE28_15705 [Anaerolineales bacterium]|nr:hypothetical protein [Anaerolineales bacterium]